MRVLCIDPSDIQHKILGIYLSKRDGYDLLSSSTLNDGLGVAAAELPDIILIDTGMDGSPPETALSKLRSGQRTGHIPVVVYTSSKEPGIESKLIRLGARAVLRKPHGLSMLKHVFEEVLEQQKESRAQ